MAAEERTEQLTYGSYLRVPELLSLQSPLSDPSVPDEMLFVIGQQAEELWFKQILHDLRRVIDALADARTLDAVPLLDRINRILRVLGDETQILESLAPAEFQKFRASLKTASGFESEQFRELEFASGLRDEAFRKMLSKFTDLPELERRWPVSLRDALLTSLQTMSLDTGGALRAIYEEPEQHPDLYLLTEACSEYELRFQEWRFRHVQVVVRVIGDRSPGTGGSAGTGYLERTLHYRFFPELWEARNALTARHLSS